ncbi:hypothetical protein JW916_04545 [Candidatus Sumerlaeota bacterium]|nr:hypothetical protein [Candidatus Sumerlaeota bacterium]
MAIVALMAILGVTGASLLFTATARYAQGARLRDAMVLSHLSQGALERARAQLRRSATYRGEERLVLGPGEASIRVETARGGYRIEIAAAVPGFEKPRREIRTVETWSPR